MIDGITVPRATSWATPLLLGSIVLQGALGCSSKSPEQTIVYVDGGSGDGGGSYPALLPDVGQLVNRGGPQLTAAKIVTVTWTADSNAATFEDYDDKLGASSYWTGTLKEYGVGAATASHVRVSAAPAATMDVLDVESWIGTQVQSASTSGWPAYGAQTLYVVWVPPATKLTAGGADACVNEQGTYHSEVSVGTNNVPYVLVDEGCNGSRPLVEVATEAGGHAIAESVTDPHLYTAPAVLGFDDAHIAWLAWAGATAEVADVCQRFSDAYFQPSDLPYSVQRLWSNDSAKAGHDPCVPAPTGPYYNVSPQALQMLSTVVIGTATKAVEGLGYDVPVSTTKTFEVRYFSDAPLNGPITLTAVEGDGFTTPTTKVLGLVVKKGSGHNGDTDTVTVTMNPGSVAGNAFLMTLVTSVPAMPTHYMPVLIEAL